MANLINLPSINILRSFQLELYVLTKRHIWLQGIALALVIIIFFISAGVETYHWYSKRQLEIVNKAYSDEQELLSKYTQAQKDYLVLKRKAQKLTQLEASLQMHHSLVKALLELIPDDLIVSEIRIGNTGEVSFTASTLNPTIFHTFLQQLSEKEQIAQTQVENVTLTGVTIDQEGLYSFGVILTLQTLSNLSSTHSRLQNFWSYSLLSGG